MRKPVSYTHLCDSQDSEELAPGGGMAVCMNCGGELKPGDYMSAVKCEHCGTYVIFEERTEGCYKPVSYTHLDVYKRQGLY